VVFAFLYTLLLSYCAMGDLLVWIFFGPVPVAGTYFVQTGTMTPDVWWLSAACGLLIDTLLVVNNYRDRDTDRDAGKQTIIVRWGAKAGQIIYLGTGITACLIGIIFWINGHVLAFIMPFIYLIMHYFTYLKIKRIDRGKALNMCLSDTARNILIYGLTVTIGVILV
jgi:1,4-dihydroxy-2-naphthoate octaprenyltransferase